MANSQLIGVCGHPDVLNNLERSFYANRDAYDAFARSGSLFMAVYKIEDLQDLRKKGGILIAVITSDKKPLVRAIAEHADRTITTDKIDHDKFAKVVHETIYGRPPVNRDNPREFRPL